VDADGFGCSSWSPGGVAFGSTCCEVTVHVRGEAFEVVLWRKQRMLELDWSWAAVADHLFDHCLWE
jgi:hypothetical protein